MRAFLIAVSKAYILRTPATQQRKCARDADNATRTATDNFLVRRARISLEGTLENATAFVLRLTLAQTAQHWLMVISMPTTALMPRFVWVSSRRH